MNHPIKTWRLAMRALLAGAFLISGALLGRAQTTREPITFFKEHINLTDGQIADIERGKPVVKVLSTPSPDEVAVFGAIFINASPEEFLKAAQNLDALRNSPNYLGVRRFSSPPKLADLEGFALGEDDIKDLKNCKPGDCKLQLPVDSMADFKAHVNWSAPDVSAQVNNLVRKMALDALVKYQQGGSGALGSYYDKEHLVYAGQQFESEPAPGAPCARFQPALDRAPTLQHLSIPPESVCLPTPVFV